MKNVNLLFALLLNLIVPGSGFIYLGKYYIGITTQLFLLFTLVLFCWSRTIFSPAVFTFMLICIVAIILANVAWLFIFRQNCLSRFKPKDIFYSILFSIVSLFILFTGFQYKHHWLGIHINFVPSRSMEPTLKPGDYILIDTWYYKSRKTLVEEGDIATFVNGQDAILVKRIGAWPEDIETKDDFYYMLGDNTRYSKDSRHFGPISRQSLKGKVKIVLWSSNKIFRASRILIKPE